VASTGLLQGQLLLTGNDDTLTSAGLVTLSGTSDFGLGNDTLTNNGSLVFTAGTVVDGLETLETGVNSNTTINGTVTLNDTVVENAGNVISTGGAGVITGLTSFTNTGLITMVDGAANDSLTINSDFIGGAGSKLAVDVNGTAADMLIVNGNISGSTEIDVNLVGTPLYNPTGTVIVDGSGSVSGGAFTLNPADSQAGFLNYDLIQNGNNTSLVSTLDSSVTDVALLGSLGQELWYQSFDAYHDAIMGRHSGSLTTPNTIGVWGQLYESKDRYGDTSGRSATFSQVVNGQVVSTETNFGDQLRTHRRGAQAGIEYRGAGFVIGATGGYEWARSEDQPVASRLKAEGHNYGAYALFGMESGLYGGVMIKRDDYKVSLNNNARAVSFRNDAHSTGGDAEIGFKTAPTTGIGFDFNAGMSYVETKIDPWNQYGLDFDYDNAKSWRGRLGARVLFPAAMGAFVGAKVFHEFKDDGALVIRSASTDVATIGMPDRGTWVRLEGGLGGVGSKGAMLTVWGDLGDTKAFGARVGFQF
jgi:hypothetical protein